MEAAEMTTKDDGGPAFPMVSDMKGHNPGMSLRDWFAGTASEADISRHSVTKRNSLGHPLEAPCPREQAKYRYADAMIEARK
jgi:hypothetical protein